MRSCFACPWLKRHFSLVLGLKRFLLSGLEKLRHRSFAPGRRSGSTVAVVGSPEESWASSRRTRASMQGNRSRDTRPELALRRAVHRLGLRYRVASRPLPEVRRTADLVFTRVRVAVFLDGCFWHGCAAHHTVSKSNSVYWGEKVARNRARDQDTDRRLLDAGWVVLRIWEHEDPQAAAQRVKAVVLERRRRLDESVNRVESALGTASRPSAGGQRGGQAKQPAQDPPGQLCTTAEPNRQAITPEPKPHGA
ncbi:very short patch repair endonuclease [Streptomyces tropicalis]|uniref:very short patch repair endonuclease n=1 Tax=Streptomyces tropicalis TaxID=3034234 RepID=UPI0028BDBB8B|nr:very short patch repair endonuclease [Streptomyces tropicalis]